MTKNEIISVYLKFYKKNHKAPTLETLKELGVTRAMLREKFVNLHDLHAQVRKINPEHFHDVAIEDALKATNIAKINKEIKQYNRYVVTTAVMGCMVHEGFLEAIKYYCEVNKARLIILTCADPAKRNSDWSSLGHIDKRLQKYIVPTETYLNNNLFLCNIKTSAKQINPLTGLKRIAGKSKSFISAGTKLILDSIPGGNNKYPKVCMTSGAITKPDYNTEMYMSERTGYLADTDHAMAAIVVEIETVDKFHFRHIEAYKDGSFIDLGTKYNSDKTKTQVNAEAVVFGDMHVGNTCPKAFAMGKEVCELLKPDYLFLHDLYDGAAVNHHESKDLIYKANKYTKEPEKSKIYDDIGSVASELVGISKLAKNVLVVRSNHDEWLDRYLKSGAFIYDPLNYRAGLELSLDMLDGHNPLEKYCNNILQSKKVNNVRFLSRDEDFILSGRQFASHGDMGSNGSRGSLRNFEECHGAAIIGHTHSVGRLRNTAMVGTMSKLRMGYNKGPSSWTQTLAVQYKGEKKSVGPLQLVTLVDGTWRVTG